jgi:hypothetical protein
MHKTCYRASRIPSTIRTLPTGEAWSQPVSGLRNPHITSSTDVRRSRITLCHAEWRSLNSSILTFAFSFVSSTD